MAENILEMRSITKTFPGVKALENVILDVRRGEIHAICGENGAGKSTLMKVLSGVYPSGSYDGEIVYDGQSASFGGIRDSEHVGIVIIHQELALVPYLSIAENIFLGNERRGRSGLIDWNLANAEAAKLLASVGLDENPVTPVGQLGVGKQQLVEIAKALSKDVKLLILDEPTAALNDSDSEHLLGLLRRLQERGITSIMISHKLNEITAVSDRVTVIRDGKTVETLDTKAGEVTQQRIIRGMVGRDLESFYPDRTSSPGEEVLRVEDWTVRHPTQDRLVVDGASFSVRAGEVVGIAGLMGAGRTELAMSMFGRSYGRDISGRIFMHGKEIKARNVAEAIDNGVAYATEDRKKYGLNLIEDIRRNVSAAGISQALHARLGERQRGDQGRRGEPAQHEHQGAERDVDRREAVGRQPAEGRPVQVAVHRPGRADPRRAHPRHRRRRQVRDLHDHQQAGGGRQGRRRHLVRAARAARHL